MDFSCAALLTDGDGSVGRKAKMGRQACDYVDTRSSNVALE